MGKKYLMPLLFIPFLMLSCKEELKRHDTIQEETLSPVAKGDYIVYEPLQKSVIKEGEVVFEKDTFVVLGEYTDDIAVKMPVKSPEGRAGLMNFRDLHFHVINKRTNDTVTFRKDMFKKYMHPDSYASDIMQAALFNVPLKSGVVPLMINICMPDSDSCSFFDIRIKDNGEFSITEVSEEDME